MHIFWSEPLVPSNTALCLKITDDSIDIPLESTRSNNSKMASFGVDEPGNLLITARKQVLESLDANWQSKKLLEKLIKDNIDKYSHVSEERAHSDGLISHKARVHFLYLMLGLLLVIVFSSGLKRSYVGILPT